MKDRTTIDTITPFIFLKHRLEKSDLIIVPGTSHPQPTEKACNLYQKKYANKIVFTGGYSSTINQTESEFSRHMALSLGIPEKDIYCDKKSSNTKENALSAKKIIRENHLKHEKIILVSKPYHARRLYMTFKKVFPKSKIIISPTEDNYKINETNWWKSKTKTVRVLEEVGKISEYYLKGDLTIKT